MGDCKTKDHLELELCSSDPKAIKMNVLFKNEILASMKLNINYDKLGEIINLKKHLYKQLHGTDNFTDELK